MWWHIASALIAVKSKVQMTVLALCRSKIKTNEQLAQMLLFSRILCVCHKCWRHMRNYWRR